MTLHSLTRRRALGAAASVLVGSKIAPGSTAGVQPAVERAVVAPRAELVNTLEYEQQAKLMLAPAVFSLIAGGDRSGSDRITLRPRMLVDTRGLDLSVTLFGEQHFAPIVLGPVADQKRFHPDGELATVKGASAARTVMMVSSRAGVPLQEIAAEARTALWYQVFAGDPAARRQIQDAVNARCSAICISAGAAPAASGTPRSAIAAKMDWSAVDALKRGLNVPMMVKGITTPEAAQLALQHGVDAIIVSNYDGLAGAATGSVVLTLPAIVDTVGGKVPVLVDGSFRRGTDILEALAFGARGVLVARPAMWGLAAYGADGVRGIVEMLQTELARYMAMCGRPHLKAGPRDRPEDSGEAQNAGSTAIVVTVDQQASYYERTEHDRNLGGGPRRAGRGAAVPQESSGPEKYRVSPVRLWYTWEYLDELRKIVKVPLLVKGILTADDALLCLEHGVDGVIVSNHGGRSMDYGPSTLEVLPEIVAAVRGRVPVITDSGYRRGTDILKALALGANAVLLGRAPRWALGAFGAPGVQRLLEIVQRELVEAAATAGRPTLASIDAGIVTTRFP